MTDYGSDLSCATDLTPMMVELEGDDPQIVGESNIRRLDTPRGGLVDDPDYGYDLCGELRKPMTAQELRAIPGRIVSELSKDDRNERIEADVTLVGTEELYVRIHCVTASGDEFDMTGPVTRDEIRLEVTTT